MMDAKTFGEAALELLGQISVSGAALDRAFAFKQTAEKLAAGEVDIVAKEVADEPV